MNGLAPSARFERATPSFGGSCSDPLSYEGVDCGTPGRIQTSGLSVRSRVICSLIYGGAAGADGESRTRKPDGHDVLSVACMPFHHVGNTLVRLPEFESGCPQRARPPRGRVSACSTTSALPGEPPRTRTEISRIKSPGSWPLDERLYIWGD